MIVSTSRFVNVWSKTIMSNFHPLIKVVDHCSETQFQVGGHLIR